MLSGPNPRTPPPPRQPLRRVDKAFVDLFVILMWLAIREILSLQKGKKETKQKKKKLKPSSLCIPRCRGRER